MCTGHSIQRTTSDIRPHLLPYKPCMTQLSLSLSSFTAEHARWAGERAMWTKWPRGIAVDSWITETSVGIGRFKDIQPLSQIPTGKENRLWKKKTSSPNINPGQKPESCLSQQLLMCGNTCPVGGQSNMPSVFLVLIHIYLLRSQW